MPWRCIMRTGQSRDWSCCSALRHAFRLMGVRWLPQRLLAARKLIALAVCSARQVTFLAARMRMLKENPRRRYGAMAIVAVACLVVAACSASRNSKADSQGGDTASSSPAGAVREGGSPGDTSASHSPSASSKESQAIQVDGCTAYRQTKKMGNSQRKYIRWYANDCKVGASAWLVSTLPDSTIYGKYIFSTSGSHTSDWYSDDSGGDLELCVNGPTGQFSCWLDDSSHYTIEPVTQ